MPHVCADGTEVPVPKRPKTRHCPTGIARIEPRASRGPAHDAYKVWFASGMAAPWDGRFTDHEGPQVLNYRD